MTEVHITADTECWTGSSTIALLAAQNANNAVIITAGGTIITNRIAASGIPFVKCKMNGIFGTLNLSRALRHIPGTEFNIYVHSPHLKNMVESALKLVGRNEPMTLISQNPNFELPTVKVQAGNSDTPLLMWLGNITEDCGLNDVIEQFGKLVDKQWKLRIVGQGKAKVVSPILKRTKALGISERIEWIGYSPNPYEQMDGVTAAIVKDINSIVAREFAAANIPTYTNLSEML